MRSESEIEAMFDDIERNIQRLGQSKIYAGFVDHQPDDEFVDSLGVVVPHYLGVDEAHDHYVRAIVKATLQALKVRGMLVEVSNA